MSNIDNDGFADKALPSNGFDKIFNSTIGDS